MDDRKMYKCSVFFKSPELIAFSEQLSSHDQRDDENLAEIRTDFRKLAESGSIRQIVELELLNLAKDPNYLPHAIRPSELYLIKTTYSFLSLRIWTPTKESSQKFLFSMPADSLLYIYGPESVRAKIYNLSREPTDVITQQDTLKYECTVTYKPGDIAELNHKTQSFMFLTNKPCAVLKLHKNSTCSTIIQYDINSLKPTRGIASDVTASRLQQTAALLGRLGNRSSLENLMKLTKHFAHYVRWEALKAINAIDGAAAENALRGFLADPHPHIRAAAEKTLSNFMEK